MLPPPFYPHPRQTPPPELSVHLKLKIADCDGHAAAATCLCSHVTQVTAVSSRRSRSGVFVQKLCWLARSESPSGQTDLHLHQTFAAILVHVCACVCVCARACVCILTHSYHCVLQSLHHTCVRPPLRSLLVATSTLTLFYRPPPPLSVVPPYSPKYFSNKP